jgi:hypothetical protein
MTSVLEIIPTLRPLSEDDVVAEAILVRLESCAHQIDLKNLSSKKKYEPKKNIGKEEESN